MSLNLFVRQNNNDMVKRYVTQSQISSSQANVERLMNQFYLPNAKLDFESHDTHNDWLTVGITSAQGWRIQQEDAHLCKLNFDNELTLLGVFDGHNGPEVAQYASRMLPEFIKTNDHFRHQRYVHALEQSFLQFDQSLLLDECNQCLNNIRCRHESYNPTIIRRQRNPLVAVDTGCTAVVALLSKTGHFYVANIGDSRCVMRVKGKTIPLSNDHKPTDVQERQRIEGAGCYVVNGRINHGLNLSRAFGDHLLKNNIHITASEQAVTALPDVTVCKERIRSGDFIVLACDGVWNCMSNKEVCSLVRKHIKRGVQLSKICELVVRRCVSPVRPLNGQIGGDNMTCMIVRFDREIP